MRSMAAPDPGQAYNLVDDDPAARQEVVNFAARLIGAPELEAAPQSAGLPSAADEKRVSNRKMKEKLGVELTFPSYREGLTAIWQGDNRPHKVSALLLLTNDQLPPCRSALKDYTCQQQWKRP